jgi:3-deoxy-D-manno-octulosonate 8-phosphate phosphatase (KDO 8-P phosphatase)
VWDSSNLKYVDAIALDVDGVLTDGTFLLDGNGTELKRFSFEDVMGLSRARKAGITLCLISGEDSAIVDLIAKKLGITHVAKGCKQKDIALTKFAASSEIPLNRIAYVGDDVNDLPAMHIAGIRAAPSNARSEVKAVVDLVLSRTGGNGAVREFVELLLAARQANNL